MINIQILCVGKIKEKAITELLNEYLKRLSKYAKVTIVEIEDEKIDSVRTESEIEKIKEIECNKIIEKIEKIKSSYVICLDLKGKTYTSPSLAKHLSDIATYNSSNITFVIGGSLGLTHRILKLSNESISFSTLTFPHQLFRVFLVEQIYRCFKILNNETYHK